MCVASPLRVVASASSSPTSRVGFYSEAESKSHKQQLGRIYVSSDKKADVLVVAVDAKVSSEAVEQRAVWARLASTSNDLTSDNASEVVGIENWKAALMIKNSREISSSTPLWTRPSREIYMLYLPRTESR